MASGPPLFDEADAIDDPTGGRPAASGGPNYLVRRAIAVFGAVAVIAAGAIGTIVGPEGRRDVPVEDIEPSPHEAIDEFDDEVVESRRRGPRRWPRRIGMLLVLGLTVFVDLMWAVVAGTILASLILLKRRADMDPAGPAGPR